MSSDVASVFARVGLVEACTDPHVFALSPWPRQREVLATVAGSRLTVLCLWRRSGKATHIAAPACAHDALFRPDLDRLVRPGERRYAVVVATNREQARLLIRAVRGIVEASPLLAPAFWVIAVSEPRLFWCAAGAAVGLMYDR